MRLGHFADGATLNQFHHPAVIGHAVNLRSHLRCHAGLGRSLGDETRFGDIACERFFAVHRFLHLQRRHGRIGMRVLGGADHHAVDLGLLDGVVKLAEIPECPGPFECGGGAVKILSIHIADGDNVFSRLRRWRSVSRFCILWPHQGHSDQ